MMSFKETILFAAQQKLMLLRELTPSTPSFGWCYGRQGRDLGSIFPRVDISFLVGKGGIVMTETGFKRHANGGV